MYVTGTSEGSVDFGTGPVSTMGVQDAFVAVFDENGTSLWTSTWSGAAADPANGNQLVRAIAFGPDGDVFATGSFAQSMVLGSFGTTTLAAESLRSIFLLRIDGASGDLAGARTFTAPGAQEGLAVGTPILVNGRSEVLVEHCVRSNGGLYYADKDEFIECMKLLFSDARLRAALGRNGRDYVRKNYRWDVVLGKYERIFARVRNAR